MKFHLSNSLFAASLLVSSVFGEGSAYSPGPTYLLTFGDCIFAEDSSTDVGDITCDFTANGGKDHTVSSTVTSFDTCTGDASDGIVKDTPDAATRDDSNSDLAAWPYQETSDYSVTISLQSAAAPNKQGDNKIKFCLTTSVYDSTSALQYWESRKIEFDVKIEGDFTTAEELTTSFYDGIEDTVEDIADYEFGVTAFRCDSSGTAEADKVLSLGENFFLCVEGDKDNVRITSIDNLKATKTGKELVLISAAIAQNQNTYVYGQGDKKVVIATRLTAGFFEDGQSVTLSGVANLETGQRRQLSIRNMQAADAEGSGFSMEVGIVPSNGSGASAFKATIAVFAAAVVALFV